MKKDIHGLENEILKFHEFPGFPWPVRTMREKIINMYFLKFHFSLISFKALNFPWQ